VAFEIYTESANPTLCSGIFATWLSTYSQCELLEAILKCWTAKQSNYSLRCSWCQPSKL